MKTIVEIWESRSDLETEIKHLRNFDSLNQAKDFIKDFNQDNEWPYWCFHARLSPTRNNDFLYFQSYLYKLIIKENKQKKK